MKRLFVTMAVGIAVLMLCLAAGPGARLHAQEIDWKTGALGHLAPAIGTYRYDEVLADPAVATALSDRLPQDELAALRENLGVMAPIDFIDGHLVLSGNRPHHGGEDTASVWIKIYDGSLHVVLQQGGRVTLYSDAEKFEYLPPGLRSLLALAPGGLPRALPPEIAWVR